MVTGRNVLDFVLSAHQLKLATPSQQKPFECEADPTGIYLKNSAGKPRKIALGELEEFCKEFERSGARSASHYQAQTFNASYLLALLDAFVSSTEQARSSD
jgi:hypothetical protein